MKEKFLVQYMHPFHHKWITEETCESLEEAYAVLNKKKEEIQGLRRDEHGTLQWRVIW